MQAGGFGQNSCFLCRQTITTDRFVEVGQRLIHYDCFKCRQCKAALRVEACKAHSNRFYCDPCYLKLFCSRCKICTKPIYPHDVVKLRDKKVHQSCLVCTFCKTPLGLGQHFLVGDNLFCSTKCAYDKRKKDREPPAPPQKVVVQAAPEQPKPAEGGAAPPPAEGGAAPPPGEGGAAQPPPEGGAAQPPAEEGGAAPSANPPADGGAAPPA